MSKTMLIIGIIITSLSLFAITVFSISNFINKRIKKSQHIEITKEEKRKEKLIKKSLKLIKKFIKKINRALLEYYYVFYVLGAFAVAGGTTMVVVSANKIIEEEKAATTIYNITYKDNEDNVLRVDKLTYGDMPDYGSTPTKEATAQYTYTFVSWDRPFEKVTKDATYVATFSNTLNSYTITWYDDGMIFLHEEVYTYGTTPSYSYIPHKDSDPECYYIFDGWNHPYEPVTHDDYYQATYVSHNFVGDVSWVVEGVEVQLDEDVEYGTTPSYTGKTPYKEGMVFDKWSPEIAPLYQESVTYTATFREASKECVINYYENDDNLALYPSNILEGSLLIDVPEPTTSMQYPNQQIEFAGWYTNKDLTGEPFDFSAPIINDIDLYAKIIPYWSISYIVDDSMVFNPQVLDGSQLAPYTYDDGVIHVTEWYDEETGELFDYSTPIHKEYMLIAVI